MDQLLDLETLKKLTPEQQQQVIAGVKQQAAIANAQNLITDLSEKCTQKCISHPGSSLSNSDKQCLQRCMDRFMDSWNLVSQTLQKRLQEELTSAGSILPSVPGDVPSISYTRVSRVPWTTVKRTLRKTSETRKCPPPPWQCKPSRRFGYSAENCRTWMAFSCPLTVLYGHRTIRLPFVPAAEVLSTREKFDKYDDLKIAVDEFLASHCREFWATGINGLRAR
ncbi:Tim10/DDP family zinc finger [Oesophagostomum dentatum]|uniref:Tim10/DDP family zinc finger n=1 Tax=Oesophagostomum dentatum TaxID=61180 RepID=A0A0B1T494_OESDE|nr:Tim10/DDP family zinc finger [Oesophagostomum dentatum]